MLEYVLNIIGLEIEATLKKTLVTIAYISFNGYYTYWTYYVRKREATCKGKFGFYSLYQL